MIITTVRPTKQISGKDLADANTLATASAWFRYFVYYYYLLKVVKLLILPTP